MTSIEQLLTQHCPDGVEFQELGKLGFFYGGLTGKSKDDFTDGNAKFITYMNIFSNIAVDTDVNIFVKITPNEKQNRIQYGDVLFTGSSETPDECGMSSVLTKKTDEPLYLNSFSFGFRLNDPNLFLPDFLKYLFRDEKIRKQIGKTASGVTRFNISKKLFAKIQIPIPPIEVQQEIVKILDTFTELEAKLEAELEARNSQYKYYRDDLLSFRDDEVVWKTLDDVSLKVSSGGTPLTSNSGFYQGNIPWLRTQEIDWVDIYDTGIKISEDAVKNSSAKWIPQNCVIIAMYGATAAKAAINKIPLTTNQACCNLEINKEQTNYKYVFYWISKEYEKLKSLGVGSQSNLNAKMIKNYKIPIPYKNGQPDLEKQEEIVKILDKFDALVNDISIGLPAELQARRQQYEYYRNKLLTFKQLAK